MRKKGKIASLKASELVDVLQRRIEAHGDPYQYLVNICHVLRDQQHQRLNEIATFILKQLGECVYPLTYFEDRVCYAFNGMMLIKVA